MAPAPSSESDQTAQAYPVAMTVRELPSEMRPREELLRRGATHVADEVLLAILLRSGLRGKNVIDLAREILRATQGLAALARAGVSELQALRVPGLGQVKSMELVAALELGRRAAQQGPTADPPCVRDPESVWRLLEPQARQQRQEILWALLLNTRNRLIGQPHTVTIGLLNASPVHPREVFSPAVRHNAAAVIVAHSHPSGDPTPSAEDLRVTRQLVDAARMLDIRLLDHVVIGRAAPDHPAFVSLREQGLVNFEAS